MTVMLMLFVITLLVGLTAPAAQAMWEMEVFVSLKVCGGEGRGGRDLYEDVSYFIRCRGDMCRGWS